MRPLRLIALSVAFLALLLAGYSAWLLAGEDLQGGRHLLGGIALIASVVLALMAGALLRR